jgi:ligand-binding SRPBCC domain-containing protein
MSLYQIKSIQRLPISLEQAWEFFSSPYNLEEITPADMSFHILSEVKGVKMYPGMIIHYYVTPLLGIKMEWVTEITHVQELKYFVDEQRFGPYAMWHHQHHFKEIPGGVEMTDIVDYKLPLGILGSFAHWLFVKKKLDSVFQFRSQILEKRFGKV